MRLKELLRYKNKYRVGTQQWFGQIVLIFLQSSSLCECVQDQERTKVLMADSP